MAKEIDWQAPQLDDEDAKLVEAYIAVGRSLDELPYTPQFDHLLRTAGRSVSEKEKHFVWKRLLSLRKRALLPRVFMPPKNDDITI